jgi:hypothetical protein
MRAAAALALVLLAAPAWADRLDLPAAVERTGAIDGRYIIAPPLSGAGTLRLEWTDALGRLVSRTAAPVRLDGVASLPLHLDAARAVAMDNQVRADLVAGGETRSATARFVARPTAGWDDFRVIMYQDHAPAALAGLAALGISAVREFGFRTPFTTADVAARVAPAAAADLRWYVENIATDFYSPYHMWTPEHPNAVNFRFTDLQARHRADPADTAVWQRTPSLEDATVRAAIAARLAATVRANGPYRPLYYSLGDEPGIADLAAAWDFDTSPPALAAFRAWLRGQYADVAALNAEWGSAFPDWDAVRPEGTTAAMARGDGNFAAWNDAKAFMDASFAAAVRMGSDAVHAADPTARAAIEGGQIPGWGGWNYADLAGTVDVMEIYEAGANIDIVHSLDPALVMLATSFDGGAAEPARLWRLALLGVRGLLLWDEADDVVAADGTPGPRGRAQAPTWRALAGGIGRLLAESPEQRDPVALLYSPASFRLQWLDDHRAAGDAWTGRSSELENEDNAVRTAMRRAASSCATIGVLPRWITGASLATLASAGVRVLVLPDVLALSDAEAASIRAFQAAGGLVIADGVPGRFDARGRRRPAPPPLPGLLAADDLPAALARAGVAPALALTGGGSDAVVTRRRNGAVTLLGLQGTAAGAELVPPPGLMMRDLLADGDWHPTAPLHPPPGAPLLLALAAAPPPPPHLAAPPRIPAGETATLELSLAAASPAAATVLRIDVRDPAGHLVPSYSGNAVLRGAAGTWPIAFAVNDPPGAWQITLRDMIGGSHASVTVELTP